MPVAIVAPVTTVRLPWAVISTFPSTAAVVTLPSARSPSAARYTAVGCNVLPTTTLAGATGAANKMGAVLLPMAPLASSMTVPLVAIWAPAAMYRLPWALTPRSPSGARVTLPNVR